MAEISGGYPKDAQYLHHVFNSLSPASLQLMINLQGFAAPDLGNDFAYAELGSGFGISIAGWAAQYPHATFHAIDYNPEHADWNRKLGARAGLDNLHVHGLPVGEALNLDLPRFDFIVAHGLYSWVDDPTREQIRQFVRQFLKPGGYLYLSYNAMPGFKDFEPMRHLVQGEVQRTGIANATEGIRAGIDLLLALMDGEAEFFRQSPLARSRLRQWAKENPRYLHAELLAFDHKAYYIRDMAEELDGWEWTGPAGMVDHLAARNGTAALAGLIHDKDPLTAESIRDFHQNRIFRADLFRPKGVHARLGNIFDSNQLLSTPFSLGFPRKPLPPSAARHAFSVRLSGPVYQILQSALTPGPQSLAKLSAHLGLPVSQILPALCNLVALDWVQPGPPPHVAAGPPRLQRFNTALADLCGSSALLPVLSAHGGWVEPEGQLEHLAILLTLRQERDEEWLLDLLCENEEVSGPSRDTMRAQLKQYLDQNKAVLDGFLRRHGLT